MSSRFFQRNVRIIGAATLSASILATVSVCAVEKTQTKWDSAIAPHRPNLEEYTLVDWKGGKAAKFLPNHALHETLNGEDKVEVYEVYKHKSKPEIYGILKFGKSLNGFPGILHGGISALVLDNSYGLLFMSLGLPAAFTANLNLNYRSPIYAGSTVILRAQLEKIDGRKLYMNASLEDPKTGMKRVESTTLFITMKKEGWSSVYMRIMEYFNFA